MRESFRNHVSLSQSLQSIIADLIRRVASVPQTGRQAAALVAFVAIGCALLNWGLGLIVGGIMALQRAPRGDGSGTV